MDNKFLDQLDRKHVDLVAAIGAFLYTVVAVVLAQMTDIDLGAYVVQPQISGPFALVAAGRWYARGQAPSPPAQEESPSESPSEGSSDREVT